MATTTTRPALTPRELEQLAELRKLRKYLNPAGVDRLRALELAADLDPLREAALAQAGGPLLIVTKATPSSTPADVCFQVDSAPELLNLFRGGLEPAEIVAWYPVDRARAAQDLALSEIRIAKASALELLPAGESDPRD